MQISNYCHVKMPEESKHNRKQKLIKAAFLIYACTESLKKIQLCDNNLKKSSTTKISKQIASVYSLFTHFSFDTTKYKQDYYRANGCIKIISRALRKEVKKIISFYKLEMLPLTKKITNHISNKVFV